MRVSKTVRLRVVQYVRGISGELVVRNPIFRKIYETMAACPAWNGTCSEEIKLRKMYWINFNKRRFVVSWNEGCWELTLPAEDRCPWNLEQNEQQAHRSSFGKKKGEPCQLLSG